jgi:hypothetical protein
MSAKQGNEASLVGWIRDGGAGGGKRSGAGKTDSEVVALRAVIWPESDRGDLLPRNGAPVPEAPFARTGGRDISIDENKRGDANRHDSGPGDSKEEHGGAETMPVAREQEDAEDAGCEITDVERVELCPETHLLLRTASGEENNSERRC